MKRDSLGLVAGAAAHLARRQLAVLTALALPVLLAAVVAVGLPRYLLGQESDALRAAVAAADPHDRDLFADGSLSGSAQPPSTADPATGPRLEEAGESLRSAGLAAGLRELTGPARYDVFGPAIGVDGPGIAQPDQVMPRFGLFYRSDIAAHVRYLRGSAPDAVAPGPGQNEVVGVLDVAISAEAARKLGVDVGAVLDSHQVRVPYQLRITGVFEPVDASAAYWSDASDLIAAALTQTRPDGDAPKYWLTDVLVGPGELDAVAALYGQVPVRWQYPVRPERLDIADYSTLRVAAKKWNGSAGAPSPAGRLTPRPVGRTGLDRVLADFGHDLQSSVLLASLGLGGLLAVVGAAVVLAARLVLERQHPLVALMRARGGSAWQVGGVAAAQVAAAVWPAVLVGAVAAVRLTPGGGAVVATPLTLLMVFVGAGVPVGVGLRVAWLTRVARAGRFRLRLPTRLSGELLLVILALVAWSELRDRGVNTTATGVDPLVAAAPVLLAAVGAVGVLRVYPLLVRLVGGPVARGRGGVAFLGVAQVGRGRTAGLAGLPVLLVAVGLAVFGTVLTTSVDHDRTVAAWQRLGGEVRLSAANTDPRVPAALDPAGLAKARNAPGVRSLLTARVEAFAQISGGTDRLDVSVFATDPGADADLIARSPLHDPAVEQPLRDLAAAAAAFPTLPPGDRLITTPVPVLVTPNLVAEFGSGQAELTVQSYSFPVRLVGVARPVPGQTPGGPLVVVPWAAGASAADSALRPNLAWLTVGGSGDAAALRPQIAADLPAASVRWQDDVSRGLAGSGTGPVARRLFVASEVGEGVVCAVVVVLAVVLDAPARRKAAHLLRVMGLTPGQARVLTVAELLPLTVVVVAAGPAVGLAIFPLIRHSLELGTLVGR